jgi:hypothetical protein
VQTLRAVIIAMLCLATGRFAVADFQFSFQGHRYDVVTAAATWADAAAAARTRSVNGQPGYLVRIDSAEENAEIARQLSARLPAPDLSSTSASDGGGAAYVWIGANDLESEGEWKWADNGDRFWQEGAAVSGRFSNWAGAPDDLDAQDAAGLAVTDWSGGSAGQWNDLDTGNPLYYVVEYPESGAGFQINAGLNDAWFNPATSGQGFFINVFPDIREMFVGWFTYDTERPPDGADASLGEPGHRWLTAQGPYDGDTATLTIFLTEGGVFDEIMPPTTTDPGGDGTLTIEFADCGEGLVSYEIESLGLSGEIPIQRITLDNVPLCEALAATETIACQRAQPDRSHGPNDPEITNWGMLNPLDIVDGGPGPDGIPPLEAPVFTRDLDAAGVPAEQRIVGVKVGDTVRAYPHNILDWHEIVNEQYSVDGALQRASLSYCPLTGSAVLWEGFADHGDKTFGTSGTLYNANLILYDRETKSLWSQMLEQAVRGRETPRIPERLQVVDTVWGTWRAMYPETELLTEETGFSRDYDEYPYGTFREDQKILFKVNNLEDGRLHRKFRVLGINVGPASKVYPIKYFAGDVEVVNDVVGTMPVVAAGSSGLDFGVVYNRVLEDCTLLEFEAVQDSLPVVMQDNEGNRWDVFGEAVSGPRAGQRLEKTNSFISYWYAWTAFFPGSSINP